MDSLVETSGSQQRWAVEDGRESGLSLEERPFPSSTAPSFPLLQSQTPRNSVHRKRASPKGGGPTAAGQRDGEQGVRAQTFFISLVQTGQPLDLHRKRQVQESEVPHPT